MDIKVKNKQLESIFDSMMEEYKFLERAYKDYDYYDQEKNTYVNIGVHNYYKNLEDDWEDDNWILQYLPTSNEYSKEIEIPLLYYSGWFFRNIKDFVGVNNFKGLMKTWFEKNYGLPVNSVNEY
jgi:hypothetical protein